MKVFELLHRILLRFRYPVSLPEDVAQALGVTIPNTLTFEEFFQLLISPSLCPTRLEKYMSRSQAEAAFQSALRKERFKQNTLFSYYFNEGWLEFILLFDEQSRLRRIYVQHKRINSENGVEIRIKNSIQS